MTDTERFIPADLVAPDPQRETDRVAAFCFDNQGHHEIFEPGDSTVGLSEAFYCEVCGIDLTTVTVVDRYSERF